MTWAPSLTDPVTVTMKYPADADHKGCFSLTADMTAAPQTQFSVSSLATQSAGSLDPSSGFPEQSSGLFSTALQDLEVGFMLSSRLGLGSEVGLVSRS